MACESLAYDTIEYFLNHTSLNLEKLQNLQSTLTNINNQICLHRAFIGDRCLGHDGIMNMENF